MAIIIYGIKNCTTMKKAMTWLTERGIDYRFHDYRVAGLDHALLEKWLTNLTWQTLINTRGTTWRKFSPAQQAINSDEAAIELMVSYPSIIRRPVLEIPGSPLLVGFNPDAYTRALNLSS